MIKSPKYNENGTIDCILEHPHFGDIPFTADENDTEEHGRIIYQQLIAGDYGDIEPYIAEEETTNV